MKIRKIIAILFVLGFCGIQPNARAEDAALNEDSLKKVDELRQNLVSSFEKGDIDSLLKNVDPKIVVTWQNGEVTHGQDGARKFFERMMVGPNSVVEKVKASPVVEGRMVFGDHIVSYGHMQDQFLLRGDERPLAFDSRFSALLERDGDRFILAGLHLSANVFDNPLLEYATQKLKRYLLIGFPCLVGLGFLLSTLLSRRKNA